MAVELRTLQVTDVEDSFDKYQVVTGYLESKKDTDEAVDGVFFTGDMIQAHIHFPEIHQGKTAWNMNEILLQYYDSTGVNQKRQELNELLKEHNVQNQEDFNALDDPIKKIVVDKNQESEEEHTKALEKITEEQIKDILKPAHDSYQKWAEEFSKTNVPVFVVFGNHDLTLGYDHLSKYVTILEKTEKATIKGKSGIEFVLKGDINSWEIPGFYTEISPLLKDYFIPYKSGHSLSELSKKENELRGKISEGQNDRLEKLSKGEEPQPSEEDLNKMKEELEYTTVLRKDVLEFQQAERQRLGNKDEVNIYINHKLPHNDNARPDSVAPISGEIALEYSTNANAVYGGHFHDGQIGKRKLTDITQTLQEDASLERITIDGQEVPIVYLDKNESWELNPGTDHFLVTEYNAGKQVEQVVIHEFVYEEAA